MSVLSHLMLIHLMLDQCAISVGKWNGRSRHFPQFKSLVYTICSLFHFWLAALTGYSETWRSACSLPAQLSS